MANRNPPFRKSSRAIHKWVGLVALVYIALMGATGFGLNHPDWIDGIDLPRRYLPGDYDYRHWNRNGLRGGTKVGDSVYLFGEVGVWKWDGVQASVPSPFSDGLSPNAYRRDTRALLFVEESGLLLAATRGGLFSLALRSPEPRWQTVALGGEHAPVIDLTRAEGAVLALTRSHIYRASLDEPLVYADATPLRPQVRKRGESLFRLIFEMHYGETWGWPGRLVADGVGLLLIFFSVTGGWFWWRKNRRTLTAGRSGRWARKGLGWHVKLGLWSAPLILFIALTGIFQRPPFLVAIANVAYDPGYYPGVKDPNPWHDKFRRVVYDDRRGVVTLSTADGFFEGVWAPGTKGMRRDGPRKEEMRKKYKGQKRTGRLSIHPVPGGPPVSVMGATVLKVEPTGIYWVGSMSGLYSWDRVTGSVHDAFTREIPMAQMGKPTGENMVVARVDMDDESGNLNWLWADYDRGLLAPEGRPAGPRQPESLTRDGRISLWHAMFEFHNGRLFGFLFGWWSWIVVPLGGLSLALVGFTGFYDRFMPRLLRGRRKG